jgi:hypothetical protein
LPEILQQSRLQRAVYNGIITAKHGRTIEELGAISGALALLANIIMAWNTHRLQLAATSRRRPIRRRVLKGIAPIAHKHINLRSILTFDLSRLGSSLLGSPTVAVRKHALGLSLLCSQSVAMGRERQRFELTNFP